MKRFVCLSLALIMLCACIPAFAIDHTAYSQYPLVADGEEITVSVITTRNEAYGKDAKDMWFWQFSEAASGLKFDVEQVLASAVTERKKLMFASNDLKEVIMGFGLNTDELTTYGADEGQLYALEDLITPERTPYIYRWLETYPDLKAACTCYDGHIYTLPAIVNAKNTVGNNEKIFINQNWLDELGLEVPETLDDFTAMLRAFKEKYPDCIPLGTAASKAGQYNAFTLVINAFGFLTGGGNDFGYNIAIRNGEAVIPAADPVFKEVLTVLNQYYTDGLLAADIFTMDNTALNADMAAGKIGVYPYAPYIADRSPEFFQHWTSVKPLTNGEYNDKQQWISPNPYEIGGLCFAASTSEEKMDKILRYFDFFYSDLGGNYLWEGPLEGSPDTLDKFAGITLKYDETTGSYNTYRTAVLDLHQFENANLQVYGEIAPVNSSNAFGNRSHSLDYEVLDHRVPIMEYLLGMFDLDHIVPYTRSLNSGDGCFRTSMIHNIQPYEVSGFPYFAYFTTDQIAEMNEINALLQPYVTSEVAKFITGARSLDEFDSYISEMEALGVRTLEGYYQEYWEKYNAD